MSTAIGHEPQPSQPQRERITRSLLTRCYIPFGPRSGSVVRVELTRLVAREYIADVFRRFEEITRVPAQSNGVLLETQIEDLAALWALFRVLVAWSATNPDAETEWLAGEIHKRYGDVADRIFAGELLGLKTPVAGGDPIAAIRALTHKLAGVQENPFANVIGDQITLMRTLREFSSLVVYWACGQPQHRVLQLADLFVGWTHEPQRSQLRGISVYASAIAAEMLKPRPAESVMVAL